MGIKGSKKVELNIQTILTKISEYDIFKFYMPSSWSLNVACSSPFRKDKNPSFIISSKYKSLSYIDFGDTSFKGNCFHFVRQLYNLPNLNETLIKIDKDFGLGISKGIVSTDYKKIISNYKQPTLNEKKNVNIQLMPKSFTLDDLAYWNMFHQDISDLKRENIYSIDKLFLNKKRFSFNKNEPIFGYLYEGKWKIYRPFENKKRKWIPNNVPITVMDGIKGLEPNKLAFINKSKKDYMVIRKLFTNTCAVQNEGIGCFSEENIKLLKNNSNRQILSFDSDDPGVKSSKKITEIFDFDYCNVPRHYLAQGIKDWADLAKLKGMNSIEKYLIEKNII
jgi:hypothetical protein